MSKNYIEEFFISIGFDTNKVKSEAKKVDGILNDLTNKVYQRSKKEQKAKENTNKAILKNSTKTTEKIVQAEQVGVNKIAKTWKDFMKGKMGLYMKEEGSHKAAMVRLSNEWKAYKKINEEKKAGVNGKVEQTLQKNKEKKYKASLQRELDLLKIKQAKQEKLDKISIARRKQALSKLTSSSGNKITAKNSMFEPVNTKSIEQAKQAEIKALNDIESSKRQKFIARKKRLAELNRQRLADEEKFNKLSNKNLQQRLKIFKANKRAAESLQLERDLENGIDRKGAAKLGNSIKSSQAYNNAAKRGGIRDINTRIKEAVDKGNINALRKLRVELKKTSVEVRKLSSVQKGLTDSTRNMIRSYASVFALFQGTVAIKRVGQDFQGMRAAMLAASGSAPAAAKDLAFVNDVAQEMGLNLKDSTDAFVKLKFAAKGKMDNSQINALFKNVSMFGTALKVDPEDQKRAMRALQQMMSKGKVMAEELKNQLGDALPASIQIFAKALNITEAQLFKQMELGKLMSADVLPKVALAFKEAAMTGGAYAQALKGLRVTEGQYTLQTQRAADTIFKSGFSDGLASLYESLQRIFKNSTPQLEKLGRVFGMAFKAIGKTLEILNPLLKIAIDNMGLLFGAVILSKVYTLVKGMQAIVFAQTGIVIGARSAAGAMAASWAAALLPITAILSALTAISEVSGNYQDGSVNIKEAKQGYQIINGRKMQVIEKNGSYYSTGVDLGGIESNFVTRGSKGRVVQRGKAHNAINLYGRGGKTPTYQEALSGINKYNGSTQPIQKNDIHVNITGVSDKDIPQAVNDKILDALATGGIPQSR